MNSTTRTRTVTWDDPWPALAVAGRLSGQAYLREMIEGRLPRAPIAVLIGFETMEIGDGTCRLTLIPAEHHTNPLGGVHGGVIATLLDSVLGCALHTQLQPGEAHSTATLEIKYLRPVTAQTGPITADAHVVHKGRALATTEARLTDAGGKLLATATSTLAVFAARPTA